MIKQKYWIIAILLVAFLAGIYFLAGYYISDKSERYVTDKSFIMLENTLSPDKKHRMLVYHYDTGALGYSRAFWAITPFQYQNLNLADYELPDGYQAKGWSDENDLLVEKWEPYYYRRKSGQLKTGDIYNGVRIKLTEASQSKPKSE